jgi:GT2 family glycosyltransferase
VWNDDCIPDDNVLKLLTEGAARHGLTLAAPVIVRAEGEQRQVEMGWELFHGGVRPLSEPWVEGSKFQPLGGNIYAPMFLVRRDAWEWAGGFDERYAPGYYEDADLVRRLAASGYKCGVITEARALHFSGSTFRRLYSEAERSAITKRNRQFYNFKFGGA